jgi:hypothetical protein
MAKKTEKAPPKRWGIQLFTEDREICERAQALFAARDNRPLETVTFLEVVHRLLQLGMAQLAAGQKPKT